MSSALFFKRLGQLLIASHVAIAASALAQPTCPGAATLTIFVDNASVAPIVNIVVDGELAADAVTCLGAGATSYQQTIACMGSPIAGSSVVRCEPQIAGLQPGTWVHRVSVTVRGGRTQQQQARRD